MHLTKDLIKRQSLLPEASNDAPYSWRIALHHREPFADAASMTAAEQMFFLGAPVAHVVRYEEHMAARRADRTRPSFARLG